jgi:Na+-transporting NADH:ubiquinone oxidoreductase subunit D
MGPDHQQVAAAPSPTKERDILVQGLWRNNPIFRMILGICSTLAVTNMVANGIAMGLAVLFVTCASSTVISLMRNIIPGRVRIAVFMLVVATFVIIVDQFFKAYFMPLSKAMGPYVALIITNCIIMGRLEAFAAGNKPWYSFLDAVGVGLGYTFVLVTISIVRELLGFGSILGYQVMGRGWVPWVSMVMPPGAFLILGIFIWIQRAISPVEEGS